jgi:drug/metabolite transporter (DMT)-like permease
MGGAASATSERLAIQLMIAQGALFAAETAAIHHIGTRVPLMVLALIRGTAGLVLAIIVARTIGLNVLRTKQLSLQLARGCVGLLYMWVMIYSFGHLPFADATAISYTQAAYIALFSVMLLGEPVTRLRWLAAAMGICGALLIAKPAFAGWNNAYLIAVIGTSLNGFGFVLNKHMNRVDRETTTMFYTNLVLVLGNLPALVFCGLPVPETVWWLPAVFILGPIGMYVGIVAVKHSNPSALGPYTLLRLVIGLFGAVIIFHEFPDGFSAAGAGLILASCVLSSYSGGRLLMIGRIRLWSAARGLDGRSHRMGKPWGLQSAAFILFRAAR